MGVGLRTHPKVVRIASALKADRLRVIGGLHAAWSIFDEHSLDGFLEGYTHAAIDEELGWRGFAKAMEGVGWLTVDDAGAYLPDYSEHNGATAKRRAMETSRKGSARKKGASKADKSPQGGGTDSGQMSASDADEMRNRGRVREELLDTPPQEGRGERLDARASRLPPHWRPSETLTAWAKSARPDIQGDDLLRLTQDFRDHYRSTGARREDWDAAWQKWVRGQRAKQPAAATAQAPNAASHSVEKAREVIEETRAAARTAVPMPKAIRDLLPKLPAGDQEAA